MASTSTTDPAVMAKATTTAASSHQLQQHPPVRGVVLDISSFSAEQPEQAMAVVVVEDGTLELNNNETTTTTPEDSAASWWTMTLFSILYVVLCAPLVGTFSWFWKYVICSILSSVITTTSTNSCTGEDPNHSLLELTVSNSSCCFDPSSSQKYVTEGSSAEIPFGTWLRRNVFSFSHVRTKHDKNNPTITKEDDHRPSSDSSSTTKNTNNHAWWAATVWCILLAVLTSIMFAILLPMLPVESLFVPNHHSTFLSPRMSMTSLRHSSTTCWAWLVNDFGSTFLSSVMALAALAGFFFFVYLIYKLSSRQSYHHRRRARKQLPSRSASPLLKTKTSPPATNDDHDHENDDNALLAPASAATTAMKKSSTEKAKRKKKSRNRGGRGRGGGVAATKSPTPSVDQSMGDVLPTTTLDGKNSNHKHHDVYRSTDCATKGEARNVVVNEDKRNEVAATKGMHTNSVTRADDESSSGRCSIPAVISIDKSEQDDASDDGSDSMSRSVNHGAKNNADVSSTRLFGKTRTSGDVFSSPPNDSRTTTKTVGGATSKRPMSSRWDALKPSNRTDTTRRAYQHHDNANLSQQRHHIVQSHSVQNRGHRGLSNQQIPHNDGSVVSVASNSTSPGPGPPSASYYSSTEKPLTSNTPFVSNDSTTTGASPSLVSGLPLTGFQSTSMSFQSPGRREASNPFSTPNRAVSPKGAIRAPPGWESFPPPTQTLPGSFFDHPRESPRRDSESSFAPFSSPSSSSASTLLAMPSFKPQTLPSPTQASMTDSFPILSNVTPPGYGPKLQPPPESSALDFSLLSASSPPSARLTPPNHSVWVKENPFVEDEAEVIKKNDDNGDDDRIEAELRELGGQMVGSVLGF